MLLSGVQKSLVKTEFDVQKFLSNFLPLKFLQLSELEKQFWRLQTFLLFDLIISAQTIKFECENLTTRP